jgi:hypothetical protein
MTSLLRQQDIKSAEEIFRSMEELASDGDLETQELVQIGFLENIGDDPAVLREARRLMGPATERLSQEIERAHGREDAAPD